MLARARKQRPRPVAAGGRLRLRAAARQRVPGRRRRGNAGDADPAGRCTRRSSRPCRERCRRSGWTRARPVECAEITAAMGGAGRLAQLTGSRAFERFTGPQIRRFAKQEPAAYARDRSRIHLVSSFLASLLVGRDAPIDPGDGSGMNLMDLGAAAWWTAAQSTATAPDLAAKTPADRAVVDGRRHAGALLAATRHGVPAARTSSPGRATTRAAWSARASCAKGVVAHFARHERHDFRPDARAARRRDRHGSRVRRADRRIHGHDGLQQRFAGARTHSRRVRFELGRILARARDNAAGQRRRA